MRKRYPLRGDQVQERTTAKIRQGYIKGFVEVDGEDYVEVQFSDELYVDQIPLGWFSRSQDTNGYWNAFLKCWCLDMTPEQIEAQSDPEAQHIKKHLDDVFTKMNVKLLNKRLETAWNYNILQLHELVIEVDLELREVGQYNPYRGWYLNKSLDYKRLLDLRIRGDVAWQTSTVDLARRYGLDALGEPC